MTFKKAVKHEAKLRMALTGPSGAGKTWTALEFASALGKKIAVIDTERGSASKYADQFSFDVLELEPPFSVARYIAAIQEAEAAGYDVLIIDSMTHAWTGSGGLLDEVDQIAKRQAAQWHTAPNTFAAWKEGTPIQNKFYDTITGARCHVIVTMRSKTKYVQEDYEDQRGAKKTKITKQGMEPIQREGGEYEMDIVADMTIDNNMIVNKSRCPALTNKLFEKPSRKVIDEIILPWLAGERAMEMPEEQKRAAPKRAVDTSFIRVEGSVPLTDERQESSGPTAENPVVEPKPQDMPKPAGATRVDRQNMLLDAITRLAAIDGEHNRYWAMSKHMPKHYNKKSIGELTDLELNEFYELVLGYIAAAQAKAVGEAKNVA
jgi:hypothetical protein